VSIHIAWWQYISPSTADFLHCRCLPQLQLLSPNASAFPHRRCLPLSLVRPPIPAASPKVYLI